MLKNLYLKPPPEPRNRWRPGHDRCVTTGDATTEGWPGNSPLMVAFYVSETAFWVVSLMMKEAVIVRDMTFRKKKCGHPLGDSGLKNVSKLDNLL